MYRKGCLGCTELLGSATDAVWGCGCVACLIVGLMTVHGLNIVSVLYTISLEFYVVSVISVSFVCWVADRDSLTEALLDMADVHGRLNILGVCETIVSEWI